MTIELSPELERFVREQVSAGHFASPTEVVAAGLSQMMQDEEFDEEDLAAIEEAERDIAAGNVFTVAEVRREFLGE